MDSKGTNGGARMMEQEGVTEDCISERRLWTAVVVTAVEDWRNGFFARTPRGTIVLV